MSILSIKPLTRVTFRPVVGSVTLKKFLKGKNIRKRAVNPPTSEKKTRLKPHPLGLEPPLIFLEPMT